MECLIDDAAGRFLARFARAPEWASAAPGRVNLLGEHTDYNAGFVLPMAIDRWCVCVGAPSSGRKSRLIAADIDESVEVSLAGLVRRGQAVDEELPPWAKYLVGAMVERLLGLGAGSGQVSELDVLAVSTVPVGGGLSSSAAVETAGAVLVEMVLGYREVEDDAARLARALACQRAEHRWAGVPCGLMDQLASSFGCEGSALLIDCQNNTIEPVWLPDPGRAEVLVVNSGVRHSLASGEYARRRAVCGAAAEVLGVGTLRELDTPSGHGGPSSETIACDVLDDEQARCVRHVVRENHRVLRAVEAFRADKIESAGRLMVESHASLRDDFRVSCPELDVIVERAVATPGVYGARMTGGGFGGCAVVLASPAAARALGRELPAAYAARTGAVCTVERVIPAAGAAGVALPRGG